MINSTVSPQICCIKSIKAWFTHPQICGILYFVDWTGLVKRGLRIGSCGLFLLLLTSLNSSEMYVASGIVSLVKKS